MIAWLAWVPVLFFFVIIQKIVVDALTFHYLSLDLTMIFIVFAGLNMGMVRGSILTMWAGFLVSVLIGAVSTLFMCVYMVVFFLSSLVSVRVLTGNTLFIVAFTALCATVEGILLMVINWYYLDAVSINAALRTMLPQIPILGILSPFFFHGFRKIEELIHVRKS